jgi:PPP family 3-phenylpropionic acid transporter
LFYAVCTFAAGAFFRLDRFDIFLAYGVLTAISLIPLLKLPKVPGYRFQKTKIPFYRLFKNKPLTIMYCFIFCVFLTSSYYYSFFLLYFTSDVVGGTTAAYGICNALASVSEFPFLLAAGKLIRRFGVTSVFLMGLSVLALRWLLLGLVPNPYALPVINMLHGFSFACINYCAVIYINQYVQPEFKALGQTFNGIICYGITKVVGSAAGGALTGKFGYRAMFVAMGIFMALVAAVFAFMIPRLKTLHK